MLHKLLTEVFQATLTAHYVEHIPVWQDCLITFATMPTSTRRQARSQQEHDSTPTTGQHLPPDASEVETVDREMDDDDQVDEEEEEEEEVEEAFGT